MVLVGACVILAGFLLSCLALLQIVKPFGWLWMSKRVRALGGLIVGLLLFPAGGQLLNWDYAPPAQALSTPATPPPSPSPAAKPTQPAKAPDAARDKPTKEFAFVVQGGQRIIATTQADPAPNEKRTVVFTPFLEKTDGNLYMAALESLWNLHGKQRGLFQLGEAQMRENAELGGNAICWRISNPIADYCIFPTKDTSTGRIGALTVWIE